MLQFSHSDTRRDSGSYTSMLPSEHLLIYPDFERVDGKVDCVGEGVEGVVVVEPIHPL